MVMMKKIVSTLVPTDNSNVHPVVALMSKPSVMVTTIVPMAKMKMKNSALASHTRKNARPAVAVTQKRKSVTASRTVPMAVMNSIVMNMNHVAKPVNSLAMENVTQRILSVMACKIVSMEKMRKIAPIMSMNIRHEDHHRNDALTLHVTMVVVPIGATVVLNVMTDPTKSNVLADQANSNVMMADAYMKTKNATDVLIVTIVATKKIVQHAAQKNSAAMTVPALIARAIVIDV